MFISIQQRAASALGLVMAVSSAPLNERTKLNLFERGVGLGWLCHFDGLASPSVDASLNLPLMLGGLCAKVNYDYDGCNSFKPLDKTPGSHGHPVKAQSIEQDDDSKPHVKPKHHTKPKHNNGDDPDSSVGAQSFNNVDGNDSDDPSSNGEVSSPSSHHKKPKHHNEDGDGHTGAQSFNDSGDDDKPKKTHSSSVGALGSEDDDDSHRCTRNEYYSSELQKCVNKSFFSKANEDSTCKNGKLDALLKLCLDISILGLTKPLHAEATVLPFGPGRNGQDGCPVGQQLSSLLNVCVDQKFFTAPLADSQCKQGWKLDLVLGICLDLVGCQNQGSTD